MHAGFAGNFLHNVASTVVTCAMLFEESSCNAWVFLKCCHGFQHLAVHMFLSCTTARCECNASEAQEKYILTHAESHKAGTQLPTIILCRALWLFVADPIVLAGKL